MTRDVETSIDAWLEVFRLAETLETTLARVAALAVRSIDGCDGAGVTLLDERGRPWTGIATGPGVVEADGLQYELGAGPCLDAYRHNRVYLVESMERDERWPDYTPHAAEAGIGASISLPLRRGGAPAGALNLYAARPGAFEEDDVRAAALLAAQASVAVENQQAYQESVRLSEQLSEALHSRAVIEQAKGIVMAREGCSADEAFAILRTTSQRLNVKLREVARSVVNEALEEARASKG